MFSPSLSSSLRQVTTWPVLDTLFLRRFWILLSSSDHSSLVLCTNSSPTLCLRLWGRPSLFHTSWALTEAPLASVLVLQPELQAGLPQPHSHVCMGLSSHRSQRHSDPTEMRSLTYIHTHTPCPAWNDASKKRHFAPFPWWLSTAHTSQERMCSVPWDRPRYQGHFVWFWPQTN